MGKKIPLLIIAAIVVVIIVAGLWAMSITRKSLPQVGGEITLTGLEHPVEVVRDNYGIPHIKAQSENDLYYALGFLNAQDRLWQLDIFKRLSEGRLAEIFGPDLIPLDYSHRVIGFHRLGKKLYEESDKTSKAICSAYVAGINAYIDQFPDRLPLEFRLLSHRPERWSPGNVFGVLMWQQWMVTFNWESELALTALADDLGQDKVLELINIAKDTGPTIIPESEKQYAAAPSRIDNLVFPREFDYTLIKFKEKSSPHKVDDGTETAWLEPLSEVYASNCWVVDGTRSSSGKPMLCNDPHIPHTLPSIWYMVHLSAPGIDDAAGIMTPGIPMVVMGHTRHIAWGDTTTVADTQDLYIEKLNPENPDEYLVNGDYRPFDTLNETIRYKDGSRMQEVGKEIRLSVHGPIINEIANPPVGSDTPLALRWAGYESSDMIKAGSLMLKAQNWDDFHEALRYVVTPVWNWVYADAEGNIGYQLAGLVPIRQKGRGMIPVPGWLAEYEWDGYIPYDEMPRLLNPGNGYIVTANNRVTPADYPYLISTRFAPPYRAARIEELLLRQKKLSVDDMENIQMDVYAKQAERLRGLIVSACKNYPQPDPDFAAAVELLRQWDMKVTPESAGASIFYESYAMIGRKILGNRMKPGQWKQLYRSIGSLDDMVDDDAGRKWFDDPTTDKVETRDETTAAAVAEAVKSLRDFFGKPPEAWHWGSMHTLTFAHPLGRSGLLAKALNLGPFRMGGANFTVNPANYFFDSPEKPYRVFAGPSMRTVVDFGDVDSTRMVITLGESGNRFSPHYADQLPHWFKGESLPMTPAGIWDSKADSGNVEGRLVLKPAGGN